MIFFFKSYAQDNSKSGVLYILSPISYRLYFTIFTAYVHSHNVEHEKLILRLKSLFCTKIFQRKMKLFLGLLAIVSGKTECNGSKYSPLGCFTDDPPFTVPGYRPG